MELSTSTDLPQRTLRRALGAAQRKLNRRLLARRVSGALVMGLILCFPLLLVMLYLNLTVLHAIIAFAVVNGMAIAVRLLTGTWANGIDAAVLLEQQYKAPGLFITVADILAGTGGAQRPGHHDTDILMAAANCCQSPPAVATNILFTTSAELQTWATNGLLLIALLITAEVGQAVVPHLGGQAASGVSQKSSRTASGVAATAPPRRLPGANSSAKTPRTQVMQNPPMERSSRLLAQQRAAEAIQQIQASITHWLLAAKITEHGTAEHTANKNPGKESAEALQAKLLAAARLPGVGTKTQTMLLAAAHAIHASSQGSFIPLLHRINRRLEDYLALATAHREAIRRESGAHGNSYRAGNNASLTKHTGSGAGNRDLADQTGDSNNAIVTDIPSGQPPAEANELRWGQGNPADNVKIPARYRMAVQRYFSHRPTIKVRQQRRSIKL